METQRTELDTLTAENTAFNSLDELLERMVCGYVPTLRASKPGQAKLADELERLGGQVFRA